MTQTRIWLFRVLVASASTMLGGTLAELVYRQVAPSPSKLICRDADRREVGMDRLGEARLFEQNPNVPPGRAHRNAPAPGAVFYFCYEHPAPAWSYFDPQGCVANRINSLGIRDREELCAPRAPGERRVVCIGDSFTFGWGVRIEDAWVRLVERALRASDDGVRTVNCGVTSGLFADEYALALRNRLGPAFEPDAVVVTLCLNDLIPSFNVLSHREPLPWIFHKSRIIRDLLSGYAMRLQFRIDPARDLVEELLAIPAAYYAAIPWLGLSGVGYPDLWAGGGPQRALLDMQEWCAERGVAFGVAVWPYMQGLGPGEHYPFGTIHRLVGDFCREHGIAFHDVLPALLGRRSTTDLWVHPADLHPNHLAHALAAPGIAEFVRGLLGR